MASPNSRTASTSALSFSSFFFWRKLLNSNRVPKPQTHRPSKFSIYVDKHLRIVHDEKFIRFPSKPGWNRVHIYLPKFNKFQSLNICFRHVICSKEGGTEKASIFYSDRNIPRSDRSRYIGRSNSMLLNQIGDRSSAFTDWSYKQKQNCHSNRRGVSFCTGLFLSFFLSFFLCSYCIYESTEGDGTWVVHIT